jgi:outer membrane receptor protein involved in Fe transport
VAKYQIIQTDVGARYALTPTFSVDGGLRYGFQDFSNAIRSSSITQTTVYAGLTWAPNPARF